MENITDQHGINKNLLLKKKKPFALRFHSVKKTQEIVIRTETGAFMVNVEIIHSWSPFKQLHVLLVAPIDLILKDQFALCL